MGKLNTGKMEPTIQLHGRKAQHWNNMAVPLDVTLKPLLVCLWYFLSFHPSTRAQDECPGMRKSMHEPYKRMPGFLAAQCLSRRGLNLSLSMQPNVCELLFPALVLQTRKLSVGLGSLASQEEPLQLRYPSFLFSFPTCECEASSFFISIPPISLNVV